MTLKSGKRHRNSHASTRVGKAPGTIEPVRLKAL
jgi:hypothetical protein